MKKPPNLTPKDFFSSKSRNGAIKKYPKADKKVSPIRESPWSPRDKNSSQVQVWGGVAVSLHKATKKVPTQEFLSKDSKSTSTSDAISFTNQTLSSRLWCTGTCFWLQVWNTLTFWFIWGTSSRKITRETTKRVSWKDCCFTWTKSPFHVPKSKGTGKSLSCRISSIFLQIFVSNCSKWLSKQSLNNCFWATSHPQC